MKPTYQKISRIVEKEPMFYKKTLGDLVLFSYAYVDPSVFERIPISREIRGIIFDSWTGRLIARPYHKFFNAGDPMCDLSMDSVVTGFEKIDGSMVTGYEYNETVYFASRGALKSWVTDEVASINKGELIHIKEVIRNNPDYTFIFELVDPSHRIVVPYTTKNLFLTGVRSKSTGSYIYPKILTGFANNYLHLQTPPIIIKEMSLYESMLYISPLKEQEGAVVYGPDKPNKPDALGDIMTNGEICKIKTQWYLERFHIVNQLTDKKILQRFAEGTLDEVYPILFDDDKEHVNELLREANNHVEQTEKQINEFFSEHTFESAKKLAFYLQDHRVPHTERSIYFRVFRGMSVRESVQKYYKERWRKGIL